MTTGLWPRRESSRGKAPQTSARPPVLAKGVASVVAKRMFKGLAVQEELTAKDAEDAKDGGDFGH
jgi:hypothetical protein